MNVRNLLHVAFALTLGIVGRSASAVVKGSVVFIGDSLLDYFDDKEGKEVWQKDFAPLGAVNLAIEGQTSQDIIDHNTKEGIFTKDIKPKVAVIHIGSNDLDFGGITESKVVENIGSIIKIIQEKSPGCKVIILKILPRFDNGYFKDKKPGEVQGRIKTVNSQLAKFDNGKNVTVIDLGNKVANADGTMPKGIYLEDLLHLTPTGYKGLSSGLLPKVQATLLLHKFNKN